MKFFKNSRIGLVTFATQSWSSASERFVAQASKLDVFDEVIVFSEEDLKNKTSFYQDNGELLGKGAIGYGYYIWKYYILDYILNNSNLDYIVYLDIGTEIIVNPESRKTLMRMIKRLQNYDMIATYSTGDEETVTHCDVIDYLNPNARKSDNIAAGIMLIKKSEISNFFIKNIKETLIANNYSVINMSYRDQCCEKWSGHNFGDQQIFSCLFKKQKTFMALPTIDWIFAENTVNNEKLKMQTPFFLARNSTSRSVINRCIAYMSEVYHLSDCSKWGSKEKCSEIFVAR